MTDQQWHYCGYTNCNGRPCLRRMPPSGTTPPVGYEDVDPSEVVVTDEDDEECFDED